MIEPGTPRPIRGRTLVISNVIERMGFGLLLAALAGLGLWLTAADQGAAEDMGARGRRPVAGRQLAETVRGGRAALGGEGWIDGGVEASPEAILDESATRCIELRVVDLDAHPVAALVLVTQPSWPRSADRRELRVGEDGSADLCLPIGTDVAIDAWTDDGRWGRATVWIESDGDALYGSGDTLRIAVFETFVVGGRVVDASGAPVVGASLVVSRFTGEQLEGRPLYSGENENVELTGEAAHLSDADGRFEIGVGVMGLYQIRAEHPDHEMRTGGPFAARPGERVELELALGTAGHFRGVVQHAGSPVANARLGIRTQDGRYQGQETGPDGEFDFSSLAVSEPFDVEFGKDDFVTRTLTQVRVGDYTLELDAGASVRVYVHLARELEGCMDPPPAQDVLARMVDLDHRPWIAVNASQDGFNRCEGETDDTARPVELRSLPAGLTRITAEAFGVRVWTDVTLIGGQTTEVTLRLGLDSAAGMVLTTFARPPEAPATDIGPAIVLFGEPALGAETLGAGGSADRVCNLLPPGRYDTLGRLAGRFEAHGTVEVFGGRVTAHHLVLSALALDEPDEEPIPENEGREDYCRAPFEVTWTLEELLVHRVDAGAVGVLPGDAIVAVDAALGTAPVDLAEALNGPRGAFSFELRRPDGTRARVTSTRTGCE